MNDRSNAIESGIANSCKGTDPLLAVAAQNFIQLYATQNYEFNGGDILAAWRKTGAEEAQGNWRDSWGGMIAMARSQGVMERIGTSTPTAKQSHTGKLAQWRSLLTTAANDE